MTEDAPLTADAQTDAAEPQHAVDAARLAARLGRYQLVLPLAQGGMGIVFVARLVGGHGVERLVAIKTLRPITSKSDRTALLREARLTARLHHRNVVATIDLGEVDDVPYVVMDLVDGVPLSRLLSTLLKRGERLAPELAAWIVMQAALGLHAAHELADAEGRPLDLVHRDVSPQNILLSLQGEVKIADFGIAKFAGREESTETGMIKGKFAYMSPEQAGSAKLDRRIGSVRARHRALGGDDGRKGVRVRHAGSHDHACAPAHAAHACRDEARDRRRPVHDRDALHGEGTGRAIRHGPGNRGGSSQCAPRARSALR